MLRSLLSCVMLLTGGWGSALSADEAGPAVPPALEPWRGWVLAGEKSVGCPSPYDSGTERICVWPSTLALECGREGGTWRLEVRAFADAWLALPGDGESWPTGVSLDGQPVAVVFRDGAPSLRVPAGVHGVSGGFSWKEPPEKLAIPRTIGVVSLVHEGTRVPIPDRDASGWLWLRRGRSAEEERDTHSLTIARVVEDGSPIWLRTEIAIEVSGRGREEDLGCILPEGWQLSHVEGPIPVAVDDAGRLRAQVRAGSWRIQIDAFRVTDLTRLEYPAGAVPAVAEELVGLRQRPEWRVVEFAETTPVDTSLTTYPERWRGLPVTRWTTAGPLAWVVKAEASGIRQPDRLHFRRRVWLDDDGRGVTYEDTITGECRGVSRLDAVPDHELAVVRIDGQRQLITASPGGAAGVELRTARPTIEAIGRATRSADLEAVGWQSDAESLAVGLTLPPGWRAFAILGADRVDGDWLTAWTLLDLFLLLVFALAVHRIRGYRIAILAFLAFALAYHEGGSPRFTWLVLLVPLALLGVVTSPRARYWLTALRLVAVGLLLLHLVPFVAREIQTALYPQLEEPGIQYRRRTLSDLFAAPRMGPSQRAATGPQARVPGGWIDAAAERLDADGMSRTSSSLGLPGGEADQAKKPGRQQEQQANLQLAPGTSTQTGIARPEWEGGQVECAWDGPVAAGQRLRTLLIPSRLHRGLALLRASLLIALLALLLRGGRRSSAAPPPLPTAARAAAVLLGALAAPAMAHAQTFPDPALLDALRQRLIAPADAFPRAADIPEATLTIEADRLRVEARVHAAADCAVPIPGRLPTWSPVQVRLDDAAAVICRRDDGHLWAWVPAGVHTLVAEGLLPEVSEWVWSFQLAPRRARVVAEDWVVTGLDAGGRPQGQVFLARRQAEGRGDSGYDQRFYRPVVQIDRVIEIGLEWRVRTTVRRLSPLGRAVPLRVPVVEGERVLAGARQDADGSVDASLEAAVGERSWESVLAERPEIRLVAAGQAHAVERWSLLTSPVWHVEATGLAPITESETGSLVPTWYPWPGQEVALSIRRPEVVEGRTLTIQNVHRQLALGSRRRSVALEAQVESSLGGEFAVGLPLAATVRSVRVDGRALPVRREGERVLIGLQPGRQSVAIDWTNDEPLAVRAAFDAVRLPEKPANLTSTLVVPESRWILWAHGPRRGPAVRFWAVVALAIVAGVAAGRLGVSPLATHEWVLLLVGLTQVSLLSAGIVVGWLLLLGWRGRQDPWEIGRLSFNAIQIGIVLMTIASLWVLVVVVSRGLLGRPEMFVIGSGSFGNRLTWFDPGGPAEPASPWVVTVSVWWYRVLMLLWGLWLARGVIRWLAAGWRAFTHRTAWRGRRDGAVAGRAVDASPPREGPPSRGPPAGGFEG